jgi:hypothetical protein
VAGQSFFDNANALDQKTAFSTPVFAVSQGAQVLDTRIAQAGDEAHGELTPWLGH